MGGEGFTVSTFDDDLKTPSLPAQDGVNVWMMVVGSATLGTGILGCKQSASPRSNDNSKRTTTNHQPASL